MGHLYKTPMSHDIFALLSWILAAFSVYKTWLCWQHVHTIKGLRIAKMEIYIFSTPSKKFNATNLSVTGPVSAMMAPILDQWHLDWLHAKTAIEQKQAKCHYQMIF